MPRVEWSGVDAEERSAEEELQEALPSQRTLQCSPAPIRSFACHKKAR